MPEDPLSEFGIEQTKNIVDELIELGIDTILCSPYKRAVDTATPFSRAVKIPISIIPSLSEGQLVLENDIKIEIPKYRENGFPIENESKGQFLARALDSVELIKTLSDQRVLVVCHGHIIREMLNILLRCSSRARFPHDNCGLSSINLDSHTKINYINKVLGYNKAKQAGTS